MSILRVWHINPQLDKTWNTAQPSGHHKIKNRKVKQKRFNAEHPDTQQVDSTTLAVSHLCWTTQNGISQKHAETLPKSLCYAKLQTIWLPLIQTSISLLRHHSHDTVIVFDTNPSAHPLTTSSSASFLIQLSFGMHYHLILSLLLLWISLNHRSKPATVSSILHRCKYVTFFFFY